MRDSYDNGEMPLANALMIAVWYVPVLLTFTVLMLASIPCCPS